MSEHNKQKSAAWFLLPIFLGIVGGLIAYFVIRHDDPSKAKNCLYLGVALMIVGIVLNFVLLSMFPGLESGFNVNT